jgi:hypothetical protein
MGDYIKDQSFVELTDKEKNFQLMSSILQTQSDLKQAHINFEFAEDDLIDFYSYQIKANQAKLDYLTKIAKSKNIENSLRNIAI